MAILRLLLSLALVLSSLNLNIFTRWSCHSMSLRGFMMVVCRTCFFLHQISKYEFVLSREQFKRKIPKIQKVKPIDHQPYYCARSMRIQC